MEASAGLVAGSHNRNELVVIRRDGELGVGLDSLCGVWFFGEFVCKMVLIFGVLVCSQGLCSKLAGKSVRFVGMMLVSRRMETSLWLAMSVLSLFVGIATIMSAERGAKCAHSAKLGLKGSRVIYLFIFPLLSSFILI